MLYHHTTAKFQLPVRGCGGSEQQLILAGKEFIIFLGTVIQSAGQTETMLYQGFLTGPITIIHTLDLG